MHYCKIFYKTHTFYGASAPSGIRTRNKRTAAEPLGSPKATVTVAAPCGQATQYH